MTAAATMNYAGTYYVMTQGLSNEAVSIAHEKKSITERILDSISMGERNRTILCRAAEIASTAGIRGWDGYDGLPVTIGTYVRAIIFMESLPEQFPLPELSADPDGAISMEWYRTGDWIFSISIDSNGKIDYSGIFADKKVAGSSYFAGEIDSDIIDYIGRV